MDFIQEFAVNAVQLADRVQCPGIQTDRQLAGFVHRIGKRHFDLRKQRAVYTADRNLGFQPCPFRHIGQRDFPGEIIVQPIVIRAVCEVQAIRLQVETLDAHHLAAMQHREIREKARGRHSRAVDAGRIDAVCRDDVAQDVAPVHIGLDDRPATRPCKLHGIVQVRDKEAVQLVSDPLAARARSRVDRDLVAGQRRHVFGDRNRQIGNAHAMLQP